MTQVDAEFSVRQLRGRPNIINEMGQLLEQHENVLLDEVRLQEALPVKETKVFVVSLDGANVRLNMPGKKKGRPTERPKDEDAMSREMPSCFTGGQTILALRAIVKSQRWPTFWTACKQLNKSPELTQSE